MVYFKISTFVNALLVLYSFIALVIPATPPAMLPAADNPAKIGIKESKPPVLGTGITLEATFFVTSSCFTLLILLFSLIFRLLVINTIADLRIQLNDRDQELLLNDVEIAGLPEERNENVLHLVSVVAVKLGLTLEDRDIVHAERQGAVRRNRGDGEGAPQQPRPLVVRLARRAQRDALLRAARVRRGLTTADMNIAGTPRKFYVNERLTRNNRQLFGKTREAASRLQWKYVWTKGGRIFTRKEEGKAIERISSEEDIKKIFGS
ncbi:uncharacterized protein LOC123722877 [Papilio machaon]|uniref:uncharacterized protein LOC123722877 n=1 Tax=Papilio machaon TaxID=76193 RepID=UPI001E662E0B|nr:uncharacterized protein LOC123722877 [Papilio machaon]